MKKFFEAPIMEMKIFNNEDIVTGSSTDVVEGTKVENAGTMTATVTLSVNDFGFVF